VVFELCERTNEQTEVYCGKTADRIRMPFGMMSGIGRGMGVFDGDGYRRRRRGRFGVNLGRRIVIMGAFFVVVRERHAHPKLLWGGLVVDILDTRMTFI